MQNTAQAKPVEPVLKVVPIRRPRNYRRVLYPLYVLLLIFEWCIDTGREVYSTFHRSIEQLTQSLETYIHEPDRKETT